MAFEFWACLIILTVFIAAVPLVCASSSDQDQNGIADILNRMILNAQLRGYSKEYGEVIVGLAGPITYDDIAIFALHHGRLESFVNSTNASCYFIFGEIPFGEIYGFRAEDKNVVQIGPNMLIHIPEDGPPPIYTVVQLFYKWVGTCCEQDLNSDGFIDMRDISLGIRSSGMGNFIVLVR